MRNLPKPLVGVVLWGVLAVAARTGAAEPNVIRAIDVADRGGAVELAIQGTRAPSYTVFKLQDPPRLVVDLAGADVSQVASPVEVGKAGVVAVSTAQYKDERSAVGRVIVALEGPRKYEVAPRGDAVVVTVHGDALAATPPPTPAATAPSTATPTPTATATSTATAAVASAEPEPAAAGAGDDHVVSRRVDEARVARPARAVTAVRAAKDRIVLATDGQVARIEILELRAPARLALDLHGVASVPRAPGKAGAGFTPVRFGKGDGKVRVVLDTVGTLPAYEIRRVKNGVAVVAAPATARGAPPAPERTQTTPAAAPAPAKGPRRRGSPTSGSRSKAASPGSRSSERRRTP